MNKTVCIDSNEREWKKCEPPKFVDTFLRILYDKESGMKERVYYARIKPNGYIDKHTHPTTEVFYVISGEGIIESGGEKFSSITGKTFFIPPEVEHGVTNTGNCDIELISFAIHP